MDFDYLRFRVSCILWDCTQDNLQLAYKIHYMKKGDKPIHLASAEHFEALKARIERDMSDIATEMKGVVGNSQRSKDQRKRIADRIKTYTVLISNLPTQPKESKAKGKSTESSKSKLSAQDNLNAHQVFSTYLKNRVKCKGCEKNCAIIPIPTEGPVHIPLSDEAIDLWARLSVSKSTTASGKLCNPYTPNPPDQVLDLLRMQYLAGSKERNLGNSSAGSGLSAGASTNINGELVKVSASNHALVQTSIPIPNPSLASSTTAPALASHSNTQVPAMSIPFSLASQMGMNSPLFAGFGQGAGLGAPFLSSFSSQMSQFPTSMAHSPMLMYNIAPQGVGFGMGSQPVLTGHPGVHVALFGGFPIVQLGGTFPGHSGDAEGGN
ncbi:hypothetical protein FRC07_012730 [Ceratobasidium sp. 392]|nr:hypothetical protein FRC07_012730 [Ceratobasidium sp. 392]